MNHLFSEPLCVHKKAWNTCGECRPALTNTPMTQQTLREELKKFLFDYEIEFSNKHQNQDDEELIADFFLSRFKEFAEKELIGEDEKDYFPNNQYSEDIAVAKNALRDEQRAALAEYFK